MLSKCFAVIIPLLSYQLELIHTPSITYKHWYCIISIMFEFRMMQSLVFALRIIRNFRMLYFMEMVPKFLL